MAVFLIGLIFTEAKHNHSHPMAQNEDSVKPQPKSPNSHLPGPENSIPSFDLLNYRSSGKNTAAVSAAAALILQAAADSHNSRKSMTLPSVSPLSGSSIKQRCSSPSESENASSAAAAAAASLMSRPCQHSPTTNSTIQAALALAMAASSPPSTCPSSSSSGHQGEHGTNDSRADAQPSLGAFFRQPGQTAYETVDGGGNGTSDLGFQPAASGSLPPFVPFTSSSASPDMSASACLTNAMFLPASIVNVLGQQVSLHKFCLWWSFQSSRTLLSLRPALLRHAAHCVLPLIAQLRKGNNICYFFQHKILERLWHELASTGGYA